MILLLALSLMASPKLFAATLNVSTTQELRTALSEAAKSGVDDTIILADGTYKTTDDGLGTFEYISNQAGDLTILGIDGGLATLSGDNQHSIIKVYSIGNSINLSFEGLNFIHGNNKESYGPGGAIYILGEYSLSSFDIKNCVFSNNLALSRGGAIYYWGSNLSIANSKFINNKSSNEDGGAIYAPTLTISKSSFENNEAYRGGALYIGSNYGASNISNVSFIKTLLVKMVVLYSGLVKMALSMIVFF